MPSILEQALGAVGVTNDTNGAIGAALGLTRALDLWNENNLGLPQDGVGGAIRDTINSSIPPAFRTNPTPGGLPFTPAAGDWTALHYADDLVAHHPKFKFIFKVKFVGFEGFGNPHFFYYVHRCDKPNILFEHQDVNYYNFRTRVLTKTTFQPLSLAFLDEIGNSVNDFFVKYSKSVSGQADGKWGIDNGFGDSSSTKPYKNTYSNGKYIIVSQIFGNGNYSNEFKFINPRIESFQFDELNMEDNAGSLVTVQFSYDSLACQTVTGGSGEGFYPWGNTDILKGGGSSGLPNAGATSLAENGQQAVQSANGNGIVGGFGLNKYSDIINQLTGQGITQLSQLPGSLQGLPSLQQPTLSTVGINGPISSSGTTLDRDIAASFLAIQSGANFSTAAITGEGTLQNVKSLGPPTGSDGNWAISYANAYSSQNQTTSDVISSEGWVGP